MIILNLFNLLFHCKCRRRDQRVNCERRRSLFRVRCFGSLFTLLFSLLFRFVVRFLLFDLQFSLLFRSQFKSLFSSLFGFRLRSNGRFRCCETGTELAALRNWPLRRKRALLKAIRTQEKSPGESQENRVHLQTLAFSVTHYGTYTEIEEFIKRVYQESLPEFYSLRLKSLPEEFTRRVFKI